MSPDRSLSDIHFLHSCLSSDVSISPMDNATELDFPYIEPAWPSTKLWFLCCQMHSKSDITFLLQILWVYLGLQGKVKASQWHRQGLSPLGLNLLSNLISSFSWPFILKQIMNFHVSVELPLPVIPSPRFVLNVNSSFKTKLIQPFIGQTCQDLLHYSWA